MDLSQDEIKTIQQLNIGHFYVRFFDVDWNPYEKEAFPVASVYGSGKDLLKYSDITPSVFITNAVLENSDSSKLDSLASRIARKSKQQIDKMCSYFANDEASTLSYNKNLEWDRMHQISDSLYPITFKASKKRFTEILIDCDWSSKTRDKYFFLLRQLKKYIPEYEISSTIRLWQYKYRKKAGIPPVTRGLLMCYSIDNPKDYNVENSISSTEELKKYVDGASYPVKLDIAIPVFSWGVLFRGGKFKELITQAETMDFEKDTFNFQRKGPNRYIVKTDQVLRNMYLRFGDEIRIEQLSVMELEKMAVYLHKALKPSKNRRITLFSWDINYINHYGIENIKKYYSILNN